MKSFLKKKQGVKMTSNIYLEYTKARKLNIIVDRKRYFENFEIGYRPFIMSVEGTYVKIMDILDILCDNSQRERVNDWISSVRRANYPRDRLVFYWRR